MGESCNSLVANERLISVVCFPGLVIPATAVVGVLVDTAVAALVLVGMMFFYGITPSLAIVTAPLFIFLAMLAAFGVGLWLSALNVQYRDVRYIVGFLTQLWLFMTPVVYPTGVIPARWRALYALNPMVGAV